jgi:hypothetical protein
MITIRHKDCAGTRRPEPYSTQEPADGGTQRRFLDLLDHALHGRMKGEARDFSGFTRDQMLTIAQADRVGQWGGADAARAEFMVKHADVVNIGLSAEVSNNALPKEPDDMEMYDEPEDEQEITISADLPKAGSAAGVTDGMSARDRALAIASKSVKAMQAAADAFWSTAPKPAETTIEKVQSAAAEFWR